MQKLKHLNICHLNIRGLNQPKLDAIKSDLVPTYDVISISETFLGQNSSEMSIPGYHPIIRKDRQSFGGGVAIFVKDNVLYKKKIILERDNIEAIWIEINTIDGKILFCCVYRPPNSIDF